MLGRHPFAHTDTTDIIRTHAPHTDTTVLATLQVASSSVRVRGSMATMAVADFMAEGQPFTVAVDTHPVPVSEAARHFAGPQDSMVLLRSRVGAGLTVAGSAVLVARIAAVGSTVAVDRTAARTGNPDHLVFARQATAGNESCQPFFVTRRAFSAASGGKSCPNLMDVCVRNRECVTARQALKEAWGKNTGRWTRIRLEIA